MKFQIAGCSFGMGPKMPKASCKIKGKCEGLDMKVDFVFSNERVSSFTRNVLHWA